MVMGKVRVREGVGTGDGVAMLTGVKKVKTVEVKVSDGKADGDDGRGRKWWWCRWWGRTFQSKYL